MAHPQREAVVAAPFGAVAIETRGDRLTALHLLPARPLVAPTTSLGVAVKEQLDRYFEDATAPFDLPLEVVGSPFQQRVWAAIASIPRGQTRRYGDLAAELDAPARAVGQACGDNRLPLVIPCHRVIGATGIGGFAHSRGGFALTVKRWLLEHEGALAGSLL
jgi:methylated-DNA-[protein]-cysteine S-methyltransferase